MYKKDLNTASGMWGLWNYDTYKHIDDYDKWDVLFCEDEDIIKQVESHFFVPVYIFEDGCRSFTVRIDEEPGAFLENGEISPDALSDFVVVIKSNVDPEKEYRTKINTFSEDD